MHFPSSIIIFLTVACGIATCANSWRVYGGVTLTCKGEHPLGLCLHHQGSDYKVDLNESTTGIKAVVASDITDGSGNPHPTTHSCDGSGAALSGVLHQSTCWLWQSGEDIYHDRLISSIWILET
ncbi:AKL6 [Puccinia graminis f. sp. tritici CRL 75-36-700-3]|uniref:AKL6 n=1 Tax=Puccinia graminis f. sp. tritici (strain CRL 75-36-700-3 / race SCCL) TaxID=418459 RepID=E3JSY8_PUCGT|nr:AKL6 [Puccinia graminis f. sp. tritici CRL 75-36-700-3]EFP75163.2 AKL6 [Puccinia graminis f. sp. tritici CRL 75-36-700-3]